jgi:hypothetical protein
MDERPGLIEIDLPNDARVRVDAFLNQRVNTAVIRLQVPACAVQQDQRGAGAGFLACGTMAEIRRITICAYSIQKKFIIDAVCW